MIAVITWALWFTGRLQTRCSTPICWGDHLGADPRQSSHADRGGPDRRVYVSWAASYVELASLLSSARSRRSSRGVCWSPTSPPCLGRHPLCAAARQAAVELDDLTARTTRVASRSADACSGSAALYAPASVLMVDLTT